MKDGRKIIGVSNRGSGASPQKLNNHEHGDTGIGILDGSGKTFYLTEPATDAAKEWGGYGTALKPAHEPICVARKPLIGTVAANVLEHGTGALNIDGCRICTNELTPRNNANTRTLYEKGFEGTPKMIEPSPLGRWPANVIHDGSDEVVSMFPDATGQQGFVGEKNGERPSINTYGDFGPRPDTFPRGDSGSAARFFYTAKASREERSRGMHDTEEQITDDGRNIPIDNPYLRGKTLRSNTHPTVKPLDLMAYLCNLLCPPSGGILLDPFMGSGSTIIAGRRFYQHCIGIELEEKYAEIAAKRLSQEVLDFGGTE
jgi:site-specific DNA-methyltransferase (adenine-specific)